MCKFMIMHKFFFLVFVLRGNGRRKNFTSSISVYFYLKSCSLIGENFYKSASRKIEFRTIAIRGESFVKMVVYI